MFSCLQSKYVSEIRYLESYEIPGGGQNQNKYLKFETRYFNINMYIFLFQNYMKLY